MKKPQENHSINLSIVILNYNTSELLRQCLSSISQKENYQIIVVDNASTDNSVSMLEKEFPNVQIVKRATNDGYTRGNNAARPITYGKYVLFLNSDTKIVDNAIQKVLDYMQNSPDVGIATALTVLPDGKLYYACHRGFPTPWNSFCHFSGLSKIFPKSKTFAGYSASYLPLDKIHEIDACSGTFLMIKRDLLDKIGWFDQDYYSNGEDIEMCFQIKALGFKVIFNPEAKIIHYWGASSGLKKSSEEVTTATKEIKRLWTNARYDAMQIFYDKHYKNLYPGLVRTLVMVGINIQRIIALRNI